MRVTLKLFALLGRFLPPGSVANAAPVEVPEGTDIAALIARFDLTEKDCHLVLKNGNFVPPDARATTRLAEGDVVSIWPPIGGG
ncbi:molybdopterin synthase sulfur carrier subunit [Magnetospirillum sp. ME-1]|uniref:sulfur carrier protein ThiS n=1 Tax=Magnetospirillum sp. ME-1 TaxID=1639348 RepID=UPI000A17AC9C|nr:sulfur carrier protein ThiS [Magnetospirillum sp. ME-1]ARJ67529.1 molybdopterin synthase sulfur carrier subunit [Magnetospirillum sp. ME-1]